MSTNNTRQIDSMTIARALTLAALLCEWEADNNVSSNRAWWKECREAAEVLRREAEARQPKPNYEGVHAGVA
jgi:hypothetical protein